MYVNDKDSKFYSGSGNIESEGPENYPPKINNRLKLIAPDIDSNYQSTIDWTKDNDTVTVKHFIPKERYQEYNYETRDGLAFYNLKFKGEDLKFKIFTDFNTKKNVIEGSLIFFYSKNLPFALMEVTENSYTGRSGNYDSKEVHRKGIGLYIIKNKAGAVNSRR